MEIRVPVNDFLKALTVLQGAVQKRSANPILSNVLINAIGENTIFLTATDLDVGVCLKIECEVLKEGSSTVPAKALLDIVKVLPGVDVSLHQLQNQHLSIKSGRTCARLLALPSSEFPGIPGDEGVEFYDFDAETFLSMVNKTLYSTSYDDNRYNLMGVYFEPQQDEGNSVVMVSTDGHRLSKVQEKFDNKGVGAIGPLTLPRKGLTELIKVLDGGKEKIFKLGVSRQHAIVKTGDATITMRLIDGKFPDYNQVIPKLADKIMRSSRNELLLGLKRVSVLTSEKSQCLKVRIKDGEMTVSCANPDAGEVTDDIPIEYKGPDIEIGFNAKYIIDALSSIDEENVMVKFTDPLSPSLISGMKDERHQCVIMPMRI